MGSDSAQSIAAVYAEALFELAREQQQCIAVRGELEQLAELARDDEPWSVFLASPAVRREEKKAAVLRIFSGKLSELTVDFLGVLAGKGRLGLLPEIAESFVALEDQAASRVRGTITTAVELAQDEQVQLAEQISRALNKEVILQAKVDESIIGGMVLKVEDLRFDATVKRKLENFSRKLKERALSQLPSWAE
ncbi:MAG: ATP synthase F1 subunit delta [Sedimentisphaerales bacterium]|nr:ATP synthase F1 subunit delta [Sedimentisphaerales bacterium]